MDSRRIAVVTGASSGIGLVAAVALARAGFEVFATYRKEADREHLAGLAAREHLALRPLRLDLADAASIAAAVAEVDAEVGARGVFALVNNAGVPCSGPVETLALDTLREVLEVNVVAQVAVTQAFMPLLRRANAHTPGARVINVTSISGQIAAPFAGAYAASKHALEALTGSLRHELRPFGMWASAVAPGVFRSALWQKGEAVARQARADLGPAGEAHYGEAFARYLGRFARNEAKAPPPDPVARAIVKAACAGRPKRRYLVGADARAGVIARALLPEPVFGWILRRTTGRR